MRLGAQGFDAAARWVLEHNTRARARYERLRWTLVEGAVLTILPSANLVEVLPAHHRRRDRGYGR